jgi:hypothetical protein
MKTMKKITFLLFVALTGMLNVANAQQTMYTENFEGIFDYTQPDAYVYTFAPSTKAGLWAVVDLVTDGDANINLRKGWGDNWCLLIKPTDAAVTMPDINVAGFINLSLSFEFTVEGGGSKDLPNIEASVDGGVSWSHLAADSTGGGWNKQAQSVALPAATSTLSLRMNPNAVNSVLFDNLIISGTPGFAGINQLSDNSIQVYPSQFINEFNVTKSEGPLQVSVFDVLGSKVETAKSSSNKLSMGSSLKSGVYVVKVEGANANDSKSFRIIKK